jgi:hypothetical protein
MYFAGFQAARHLPPAHSGQSRGFLGRHHAYLLAAFVAPAGGRAAQPSDHYDLLGLDGDLDLLVFIRPRRLQIPVATPRIVAIELPRIGTTYPSFSLGLTALKTLT